MKIPPQHVPLGEKKRNKQIHCYKIQFFEKYRRANITVICF